MLLLKKIKNKNLNFEINGFFDKLNFLISLQNF